MESTKLIYSAMLEAQVPIENWQSDLYVPINDKTTSIIKKYPELLNTVTTFKSETDKTMWYEIPFQFLPHFEHS
jgi:hypothetical protein